MLNIGHNLFKFNYLSLLSTMNPTVTAGAGERSKLEREVERTEKSGDTPIFASENHAPYLNPRIVGEDLYLKPDGFDSQDRAEAVREFQNEHGSVDFVVAETSHTQRGLYESLKLRGYKGERLPSESNSEKKYPEPRQPV